MRLAGKVAIISGGIRHGGGHGAHVCAARFEPLDVTKEEDWASVDADTKLDAALARDIVVAQRHFAVQFDGAPPCVDNTGKFGQKPVAGGLDDAPAMLGNLGLGHFPAQRDRSCMRALLVGTHEPAVARDIGRENGGEPPLDPLWAQRALARVLRSSRSFGL